MRIQAMNEESLHRLEIVRFYLIMKQFDIIGDNVYTQTIIETLCQSSNIKPLNIIHAKEQLNYNDRPQAFEYGLLNAIHRVPYRTLCGLSKMASKTIATKLQEYIDSNYQYPLVNRFNAEITASIIQFNKIYSAFFKHATYLSKGVRLL